MGTRRWVVALACLLGTCSAWGEPQLLSSMESIPCSATPFGRRLTLGLEQEYAVVFGETAASREDIVIHDGGTAATMGLGAAQASDIGTLSSIRTAEADLDGDGQDELILAGVKTSDAHTIIVRSYWKGTGSISASASYEWTATQNIQEFRLAPVDVTGRESDSRQELVLAYRDTGGTVKVLVLSGVAGSHAIAQASNTTLAQWTMPADPDGFKNLRLATGDVLLEGRDQIMLMGSSTFNDKRVYYLLRYDDESGLSHTRHAEGRSPQNQIVINGFDILIADLGGTAAAEVVIHDQSSDSEGTASNIDQFVRYFTRDVNDAITFHNGIGLHNTISVSTRSLFRAVAGELDRRPGAEIALVRQQDPDHGNDLLVELYKVGFDDSGHAASIGPYLSPVAPFGPVFAQEPMYRGGFAGLLDAAIGQPNRDGIGEVAVVVQDQASLDDSTPRLKVRTFAMARPSPDANVNPDPTTFTKRGSYDYGTLPVVPSLRMQRIDYEGDSVLADIDASNCVEVREPLLRSVVHLPPYWQKFQSSSGNFLAMIGNTLTNGNTNEMKYGTFTSHDVSAYLGVKVGGEIMGIGAEASVKATAGYNYQSSRGESYGTENSLSVSESQQQDHGEGLVVQEDNTYDCYTYNVHTLGEYDPGSSVRSCELIRYLPGTQTELRGFTASDLVTWDTESAYNAGLGLPAQWVPLAPDWASVALFQQPNGVNFGALISDLAKVTDGDFATSLISPSMPRPYVQIDLGTAKALTNVRVFPASGHVADLDGFSLYVSAAPFTSDAPPSGPGVKVFATDPDSRNGFDHWNVWLRDPATQAPLVGRFLRLQSPGAGNKVLAIAEIQAFADVHLDPPQYPAYVCDPNTADGLFTAMMYDSNTASYRRVDVRGTLLWKGTTANNTSCAQPGDQTFTVDDASVKKVDIWSSTTIGGSGFFGWDLSATSGATVGDTRSIEHSVRVGAELDVEAGAVAKVQAGGSYEFTSGVTEEQSTTMFWQNGLEYAGQVGGFSQLQPDCNYRAQPFAYITSERSNVGYEHQYTAVDYFVPDLTWSRSGNGVPTHCYAVPPDRFFYGGFEVP
jgi:hypothetical protein